MTNSVSRHQQAEELAAMAAASDMAGDHASARAFLLEAANLEDQAYGHIPEERAKTRAIVGSNAVAFLRQAGAHVEAGQYARRYLAQPALPLFAERYFVESILDSIQRREAELVGAEISAPLSVTLRGEGVKTGGLVALDLVLLKLEQFRGFSIRVGEWVSRAPFRRRGPISDAISRLVVPTVSPATIGSYRFNVYIQSQPEQLEAFGGGEVVTPDQVGAEFYEILEVVAENGPAALSERVDDRDYREAFLRQVRSLAPSGTGIDEIEIGAPVQRRAAILVPEHKKTIERHLAEGRPHHERESTRSGVLRAVDLDHGRVVLREGENELPCRIEPGVLDDVVGPLVNHRVAASGTWRRNAFYIADIDEAPAEQASAELT